MAVGRTAREQMAAKGEKVSQEAAEEDVVLEGRVGSALAQALLEDLAMGRSEEVAVALAKAAEGEVAAVTAKEGEVAAVMA